MRCNRQNKIMFGISVGLIFCNCAICAQQPNLEKELPNLDDPPVKLWAIFDRIARATDGMRITMPIRVFNFGSVSAPRSGFHPEYNVHVTITDAYAVDNVGARCSLDAAESSVTGLKKGTDRKDATPIELNSWLGVTLSLACDRPANGKFFMGGVKFGVFAGDGQRRWRQGQGNLYILPADTTSQ